MSLFKKVDMIGHSGKKLKWKIECDALTNSDWMALAFMISERITFNKVVGIPRGGTKLANELKKYTDPESKTILMVDDVLTTGGSMEDAKRGWQEQKNIVGYVIFARQKPADWIKSLFTME